MRPRKTSDQSAATASASWIDRIAEAKTAVSSWITCGLEQVRLSDPGSPEERAIRRLESGIKTWAPKESTVIGVSYSAASPQLAHDVVDAVTNVYLEEHVRLNHTEGSLKFFSEQAEKLEKELGAAQAELRDRKNQFHFASLDSRRAVFGEQVKDVELQLLGTQRDLAFSKAEIADLTRAVAGLKPELVTDRVVGFANEAKDLMRDRLYELQIEESKLRSRFTATNPLLVQVEEQRKEAESILKGLPDDRTQTKAELNPDQRKLEIELIEAKARYQALQSRQVAGEKQRDQLNNDLKALNEQEVQACAVGTQRATSGRQVPDARREIGTSSRERRLGPRANFERESCPIGDARRQTDVAQEVNVVGVRFGVCPLRKYRFGISIRSFRSDVAYSYAGGIRAWTARAGVICISQTTTPRSELEAYSGQRGIEWQAFGQQWNSKQSLSSIGWRATALRWAR